MHALLVLVPFSGASPFSTKTEYCLNPKKPHATIVKKSAIGIPTSSAAVMVNVMKPSETMQLTGGLLEVAVSLSLWRRSQNGAKKFFRMESQSKVRSWVSPSSELALICNGFKPKIRQAIKAVWSKRFKKPLVIELHVDKGYVETSVVEEFC